ncbi:MAG: Rieske (2Fe-2S) protein [Anaerolineae bacterium]|jgi:Rieske Fe-S protein
MNESVDQMDLEGLDRPLSRRGLLKYILLGFSALATVGGVLTPIISYLWPPKQRTGAAGERVAVAATSDLPAGQGQVFSVANQPVLVVNTADGYQALSAVCTHLGCIVFWNEQRQVISCPCHEAYFNTNGAVISGPPPRPLEVFRVQVDGGQIYVEGGTS